MNPEQLREQVQGMRVNAQSSFASGVEGMISEIRRFAAAAEHAIGEISINEAFWGIERTVRERVQQITGLERAPWERDADA